MKRTIILSIALIMMLAFALSACAQPAAQEPAAKEPAEAAQEPAAEEPSAAVEEPSAPAEEPAEAPSEKYLIGFSNASVSNPWRVAMVETFDYEVEQNKDIATVITTDANDDPQKQLADCEDLISQGVDALVVSPAVTDALTPIIAKCKEKNIPLVVVDRAIGGEGYDAFVRTDGTLLGKTAAENTNELFSGKANVCYISGYPGSGPDNERTEGLNETLKNYPDIKILAQQPGNWDEATSLTVMENLLQGYPDMDAVICSDGTEAISAYKAIKAAGKEGQIKIIAMDTTRNDALQMLLDGKIAGFTTQNPVYCGAWSLRVAIDLLNGKKLNTTEVLIPPPDLNAGNVEQYIDASIGDSGYPWAKLYAESLDLYYNGYFE